MGRLNRARLGTPGVILFYSYLVAILVMALVLARAVHGLHEAQQRLDAQQSRSCEAIAGATAYWRGERKVTIIGLNDPDSTALQKRRYRIRLHNLDHVLAAGDTIRCDRTGDR